MKRRISFQFALVIAFAILAFIIGSSLIVQNNFNKVTELNLNQYLSMVSTDIEEGLSPAEIIVKYQDSSDFLRITFMDSTGSVLADSLATELENHLSRPEFQNLGTAYIRVSDTLNRKMMYLATQLNDDLYLRVAIPLNSILPFLNDFIGLSIAVGAFISLLSILLIMQLTKNTLKPLKDLKDTLNDVANGEYKEIMPLNKFEEINGIINEINDISKLISYNIVSLNEEKQKSDFLLNHMNQGICVLDQEGKIVLVNQFLRQLFHFNEGANLHKDYHYLFRDKSIQDAIQNAYQSYVNTSTLIEMNNDFFSVTISFLEKNWNQLPSVVLIFTDVTMVKNIEALKRDFFVNASHELKSPLTSIMGSSELISSGMVQDASTIKDLTSRILEESTRMNHLVMDMLNLSKYENQVISRSEEKVLLHEVINEVKNMILPAMTQKHITWNESIENVTMYASHEHMVQLIRNLFENSIQYGNDDGNLKVSLHQIAHKIIFSVEDNGIGIPKVDQTRVFERFYRVDKARSKKTGGTGLGLSIVKHIVMIYQGQIELDSTEGKGTKITITFPLEY
jgi:two-component system phosphate regulon sensor histidine kinase PhoR